MSWFTWAWIGWGALFAVIEGIALFNKKKDDTLSEHVWNWTKVHSGKWSFLRFFVAAFMIWLTGHMVFGWWTT